MQKCRCIKVVEAKPQKLTEEMAKCFEGTSFKVGDDGYKVVYEDGYESWSPKLQPYQKRLLNEFIELYDKIDKLRNALTKEFAEKIGAEKYNLMDAQLKSMQVYGFILTKRMELEGFSSEDENIYFHDVKVY